MGKQATPARSPRTRRRPSRACCASARRKLNLVAQMIRGKKVDTALAELQFSRKRISTEVKKCLESAIANAENNHDLDVDDLVVSQAFVGKALVLKRFPRPRPRPRRAHPGKALLEPHHRGSRSPPSRSGLRRI